MTDIISVRKPDLNHFHWGVTFTSPDREMVHCLNRAIELIASEMEWAPFHQGGIDNEPGWHYWEFWRLPGDIDHEELVTEFMDKALAKANDMKEEWYGSTNVLY
jgi:hypothetical protein